MLALNSLIGINKKIELRSTDCEAVVFTTIPMRRSNVADPC